MLHWSIEIKISCNDKRGKRCWNRAEGRWNWSPASVRCCSKTAARFSDVQQTMQLVAKAYGIPGFQVYVLANGLFVSMQEEGRTITRPGGKRRCSWQETLFGQEHLASQAHLASQVLLCACCPRCIWDGWRQSTTSPARLWRKSTRWRRLPGRSSRSTSSPSPATPCRR